MSSSSLSLNGCYGVVKRRGRMGGVIINHLRRALLLTEKDLDFDCVPKKIADCRAAATQGNEEAGRAEAAAGDGNAY